MWWGLFLIACDRPVGLLTILSPILMSWFLAKKTGAPLLEEHLARTRPGYADYIRRTSGFIPLPLARPERPARRTPGLAAGRTPHR